MIVSKFVSADDNHPYRVFDQKHGSLWILAKRLGIVSYQNQTTLIPLKGRSDTQGQKACTFYNSSPSHP